MEKYCIDTMKGMKFGLHLLGDYMMNPLSGFDPNTLPIATRGLFYIADTEKEVLQGMSPYLNTGFQAIHGTGYPEQQFAQATDSRDVLMVSSTEQIIEKILYQNELFYMQCFLAQMDFSSVTFGQIIKNTKMIRNEIIQQ